MPFAAALGLTQRQAAGEARAAHDGQAARPAYAVTVRGIRWQRANKGGTPRARCTAGSNIMDKQAEYLRLPIEGGTRTPSGRAIAVPTSNVKLNKYGNLTGAQGRIKRLLNRKDTLQGEINGIAGVWQRPKQGKRRRGGSGTIGPSRV